jgi:hypothetical protein
VTDRYRISAPVTTYDGKVGEDIQFSKGVYEGEVSAAALLYFETAGYGIENLDDDPDGPGGLPAKSAKKADWEQAGLDLGLTEDEVKAPANKDELIALVTAARDSASTTNGESQ